MPKLSFMKWFPGDWLRDTGLLSAEARGVWIDVLCLAWNSPERGVYHRLKDDFCRELRIPQERYQSILSELAKVGDVMIGNDSVTIKSRRMVKQEKHYQLNANRVAKYRMKRQSNDLVMAKTLDVRRTQDVPNRPQDYSGEPLPDFVLRWQRREDRSHCAADIAMGLKAYKLGYRMEEDIYKKIMGNEPNGTIREQSISEQVAERVRQGKLERPRKTAGEILAGIRDLPKVQPDTETHS